MKKSPSNIPFNYITIKTTKSRIDKGLLAVPVSLIYLFPKSASKITLINHLGNEETKKFTPYNSSSRECRIGGLKNFYQKNRIVDGDELVIQLLDDDKYKLIPEKIFEKQISNLERILETRNNENEIDKQIHIISTITKSTKKEVLISEFVRLSNKQIQERKTKISPYSTLRENVPLVLRKILLELYKGKCQISKFTFIMKNGNPYFEIHHIDPLKGNHFKNLLVVSPNVHAQFTFADLEQHFDNYGWLRKVKFNEVTHNVYQIIDDLPIDFEKEVHS